MGYEKGQCDPFPRLLDIGDCALRRTFDRPTTLPNFTSPLAAD